MLFNQHCCQLGVHWQLADYALSLSAALSLCLLSMHWCLDNEPCTQPPGVGAIHESCYSLTSMTLCA
jgi:hypothetical protein